MDASLNSTGDGRVNAKTNSQLRADIEEDLRTLRRDGFTSRALARTGILKDTVASVDELLQVINYALTTLTDGDQTFLAAAFDPIGHKHLGADLSERREALAASTGVSARTLIRKEDSGLPRLATVLKTVLYFSPRGAQAFKDHQYEVRIEDIFTSEDIRLIKQAVSRIGLDTGGGAALSSASDVETNQASEATDHLTEARAASMTLIDALNAQASVNAEIGKANTELRELVRQIESLRSKQGLLVKHLSALQRDSALLQERIARD